LLLKVKKRRSHLAVKSYEDYIEIGKPEEVRINES
jgi:hypothetical protein